MAIAKDIAYHETESINNSINYITNEEKSDMSNYAFGEDTMPEVENVLSYAENLEKTAFITDDDEEILVSGYLCTPETAAVEFQATRDRYMRYTSQEAPRVRGTKVDYETGEQIQKQSIEAYHLIQSFPEIDGLDPRLVHHMGLEFCEAAFPGHQCVISTHMNTRHLHNHIVICAYNTESISKVHMNMSFRHHYRNINDEISLKYGLPILLDAGLEHSSMTWAEWEARNRGESWKEALKADIKYVSEHSESWEEYKQKMESAGYSIRETESTVTYSWLLSSTDDEGNKVEKQRRIRDKKLGPEYMRASLMQMWGLDEQEHLKDIRDGMTSVKEVKPLPGNQKISTPVLHFYVGRYDAKGRRRTDLEMLILKAIKIIRYFRDKFADNENANKMLSNPIYHTSATKLRAMEQSLYMLQSMDIKTPEELKARLNSTGSNLAHFKKELKAIEENINNSSDIKDMIDRVKELKQLIDENGLGDINLYIDPYSEEEIQSNRAKLMPTTPKQRQTLVTKLKEKEDEWRCIYKVDNLTYAQGTEILHFLTEGGEIPSTIISKEEFDRRTRLLKQEAYRDKSDDNLKARYRNALITPAMTKKLGYLNKKHNLGLTDIDKMSMYDAMQVIQYLEPTTLSGNLISEDKIETLQKKLDSIGFSLNRDIKYVLESEYEPLIKYLDTKKGAMPELLKPAGVIRPSEAMQIKELMEIKGVTCSIPIEELSQTDAMNYKKYLTHMDVIPDILKKEELTGNEKFDTNLSISSLPTDKKELINTYREAVKDLKKIGIDESQYEGLTAQIEEHENAKIYLKDYIQRLSTEYKNLNRLSFNITLADNKAFTHGPLYNKEELNEIIDELDKSEVPIEVKQEEQAIEHTVQDENRKNEEKVQDIFATIEDIFYDRM